MATAVIQIWSKNSKEISRLQREAQKIYEAVFFHFALYFQPGREKFDIKW